MMELPLARILQSDSAETDGPSVAKYYSGQLVRFVRRVLDIIPKSMFKVLEEVVTLITHKIEELPNRLARVDLKKASQLELRAHLARATYDVARYTEGVLDMDKALIGVIQVHPKGVLEDGIRKELVRRISDLCHNLLTYRIPLGSGSVKEFEERLRALARELLGMKAAFEYVQDYVNVYGLKVWQEEFSRLIAFNVEMECNPFVKRQIMPYDSAYQSVNIPIPLHPPPEGQEHSETFMGRLVRELLAQIDPRNAICLPHRQAWVDPVTRTETVGLRTFGLLRNALGVSGLQGMDKLVCFMMVKDLKGILGFMSEIRKLHSRAPCKPLHELERGLFPPQALPPGMRQQYMDMRSPKFLLPEKLAPNTLTPGVLWSRLMERTLIIGKCQLLRKALCTELQFSCILDSSVLHDSLANFNKALLSDIRQHYSRPDEAPYPNKTSILPELSGFLDACGLTSPFSAVYCTAAGVPNLALILFILVFLNLPKLEYDPSLDALVAANRPDPKAKTKGPVEHPIDGVPFVAGVATILQQFHSEHRELFLQYLSQYIRCVVDESRNELVGSLLGSKPGPDLDKRIAAAGLPSNAQSALAFLQIYAKLMSLPAKVINQSVPSALLSRFKPPPRAQAKRK
eukprot:NODE_557_length_1967_cov_6.903545_g447_i0.p1 GENE.NODE_557_length_1967_cov_6.903545_g447_i0~~NODE_557_length_1967_cov_6.903545_g447_i0.p1  ORF type:complete len:629 (-),score=159.71 NODE_557_length_1967_cov_6.903545_g447_i0:79-1965(-)